ncbi:MAG: hypothetical protein NVV74_23705 [Magnetospirillum sp.]|nr:hypothetical protein [Magnetospirillum sp.]
MMSIVSAIELPAGYRQTELRAFHGRDPQGVAEQVTAEGIRKGLIWGGHPACLSLAFTGGRVRAELHVDGPAAGAEAALTSMVRRMLGLDQAVELFEDAYRRHPQLGRLIAQNPGLRLPVAASPFEALSWAVTGQQISVAAAVTIRRNLIQAAGIRHSGGLLCYPDPATLLRLDEQDLRSAGFSRAKAAALREASLRAMDSRLPLDLAPTPTAMAAMAEKLLDTPGIGPWTVSYALLRGFGWLDGSLHGDVAVRRGLQSLLGAPGKLGEREAERWLAPFSPWRALIAAHLWAWNASPRSAQP